MTSIIQNREYAGLQNNLINKCVFEIISSFFLDNHSVKLEINNRGSFGKIRIIWALKNVLLNSQWTKGKNKREIKLA